MSNSLSIHSDLATVHAEAKLTLPEFMMLALGNVDGEFFAPFSFAGDEGNEDNEGDETTP